MDDITGLFWYTHNARSRPGSWNNIYGETRIEYNHAENASKLFSAYLEYSECSVIGASGFVGIHMLKRTSNLILTCSSRHSSHLFLIIFIQKTKELAILAVQVALQR